MVDRWQQACRAEEMQYYVYILFDWLGVPRYVGKGKGHRWLVHERCSDPINWMKNEFIERTWIMLEEIPKIRVCDAVSEKEAFETEKALIKAIGRLDLGTGPLTNLTDGGDGTSGHTLSVCGREAVRIANRTRIVSAETRAKMGASRRGRKHSKEAKLKIAKAHKGRIITTETREKIRNTLLGRKLPPFTEDHKRKIGMANKGRSRPDLAERNRNRVTRC